MVAADKSGQIRVSQCSGRLKCGGGSEFEYANGFLPSSPVNIYNDNIMLEVLMLSAQFILFHVVILSWHCL